MGVPWVADDDAVGFVEEDTPIPGGALPMDETVIRTGKIATHVANPPGRALRSLTPRK
jgi:hypothetical protein